MVIIVRQTWKKICIKDICESIIDCVNKTAPTTDYPTPYKMIRTSNIKNGCINLFDVKYVTKEVFERWTRRTTPQKGDIILTREAPLGEVGMITTDDHIFLGQRLMQYRVNPIYLDNRFLLYAFQERDIQEQIKLLGSGATVEHIKVPEAEALMLRFPPLPEQQAIATALSDVDALITSLDQLIAKKRDIKQATMQQLLTGRTRLPGFSGEWNVKKLGEILKVRHGKSQQGVAVDDGKYPILATSGEIGCTNEYLYDKPSVLIGRKGTIDSPQFMDTPFWTIDTLFYTEIFARVHPKFVFYLFNMIHWLKYNEASGVPSLNASTIENIEIRCPLFPEQQAIAAVLTDMDAEIVALERKREKIRALKQAMMQELLTGKTRLL